MARIYLSPLIVDIRNKQKDTVFSKWKGINYIRSRVVPANPKSGAQIAVRDALAILVEAWQLNGASHKSAWDYFASGANYSGFNAWIAKNVIPVRDGTAITGTKPGTEAILTAFSVATGGAAGQLALTFAPTPVPAGYHYVNIAIKVGGGHVQVDSFAAAVASPQTISGLTAGAAYLCAMWKSKDATPSADWSESKSDGDTAGA